MMQFHVIIKKYANARCSFVLKYGIKKCIAVQYNDERLSINNFFERNNMESKYEKKKRIFFYHISNFVYRAFLHFSLTKRHQDKSNICEKL